MERQTRKPALKMTVDDLDAYQRTWQVSAASRAVIASHLTGFFRWAVRRRLIRADPSPVLAIPHRPRRLPRPIPEDNLTIAVCQADPRVRAMLTLAACQGLRACELARLGRDDVLDDADPPVVIVHGKGSKQRIVPLGETTLRALREYGMPRRGSVFRRQSGKPLTPGEVSRVCNRFLHDLGIAETLHQLRHRAVTMVYRAERDLRAAQEFAGHADPRTTSGYSAYAPGALIRAVRALDNLGV